MMEIRRYTDDDKDALFALWEAALPDASPHNQPALVLERKLAVDDLIFVAIEDGQLVGTAMAGYDGHRGWLYSVAVASKARRAGIGGALVHRAIEELKALGCLKVNLQVRADNHAVSAFYEALGFETEARLSMGLRLY
jgi:ribosomal protein S18 acetylase RimI-like enzyme